MRRPPEKDHDDAYYARIYHRFQPLFRFIGRHLYGIRAKAKEFREPILVLSNHTTDLDFALAASQIKNHLYIVCSDHVTAIPGIGPFFEKYFHPIKVTKGGSKYPQIMDIIRRIRHGSSVLLFPEGRLSHNGLSTEITPAAAKLAKAVRCKIVTFRTEGGFFKEPRWQTHLNGGKIFRAGIVHEYSAEEVARMPLDKLLAHLQEDLYVNAYAEQKKLHRPFRFTKGLAGITRYYDVCPRCHAVDSLSVDHMKVRCRCGYEMRMDNFGFFHGHPSYMTTLPEWEQIQLQTYQARFEQGRFFKDEGVTLYEMDAGRKKELVRGTLTSDAQGFTIGPWTFSFEKMMLPEILNGGRQMEFTHETTAYMLEKDGCLNKYRDLYRWAQGAALVSQK